jgi:hypothetical protein
VPQEVAVTCQRFEIHNNGKVFPYFLGALNAKEIKLVSDAPSFGYLTPNNRIAAEVLEPPTEHWQRPLKEQKVKDIAARFDLPMEIMPNPVLLAVNPAKKINVHQDVDANGHQTGLWTIRIQVPENNETQKPLWIIDGQHRVMGMAETLISQSPLPFVLLYSDGDDYIPSVLAKIFAQVTTEATPLNGIHQAWMQFVFNLGDYQNGTTDWRAMRTAAILCSRQSFDVHPNPFYSTIGFNPELPPQNINPGGFSFDANYLKDLLKEKYFKNQGGQHSLNEEEVAKQVSLAVVALKGVVRKEVERSAFFGEGRFEQKYFRDGYISGACSYLLENGSPRDWVEILNKLNFQNTNWDVSGWVNTTGGSAGTISKKVAFACFEEIFRNGKLPENVENICTYLQGKESYLNIEYKLVDEDDNIIRNSSKTIKAEIAAGIQRVEKNIPQNARYIKISTPCINIGQVSVSLQDKPFDVAYNYGSFKKGKLFTINELKQLKNKIALDVKVDYYGDVTFNKKIVLNVKD